MAAALEAAIARGRARRRLPAPEQLSVIRRRAGLSIADLAGVLDVTVEAVRHWEQGRRKPRGPRLEAYLKILDRLAAEALRS